MAKERRYLAEVPTCTATGATIAGYAAKFNVVSEDLGGFREVLMPGSIVLDDDVRCNLDHDESKILGRTTSGTLKVAVDEIGLRFECETADTTIGRDTCVLVARGDIRGNSFAMDVQEEEWATAPDGLPLRQITRCVIDEVSPVIRPAYPDTELALRSLAHAKVIAAPRLANLLALLRVAEAVA